MLKIFFSLLICVLGYGSKLENIIKECLGEYTRAVSPLSLEDVSGNPAVNTLNEGPVICKKAVSQFFYGFDSFSPVIQKMKECRLYVLVPVHDSALYIGELVDSINKAMQELPEGCETRLIFRIDDNKPDSDIKALRKALKKAEIPTKSYDISKNTKNEGVDFTRQALLDKMIEINKDHENDKSNTYFVFLDSDDVINKSTFKIFLSVALLHEDKWMFDFEHCIRCFNEDNKSKVVLDTDLFPADFFSTYYEVDFLIRNTDAEHFTNFDERGLLKIERCKNICGYCPVLYKYDETRVKSCKNALLDGTLEHFSPGYADKKNLNKCGTTAPYDCPGDGVIPEGYFEVFPRGFDTLTAEEIEKKGALYYYRRHDKGFTNNLINALRRLKFL